MSAKRSYAERKLQQAMHCVFAEPVTAYLTHVQITSCCATGVVHRHVRFPNGHRIRTSDIQQAFQEEDFWLLLTASGSRYVSVTFHRDGGRQSLSAFLKVLSKGFFAAPGRLQ